MQRRLCLLAVLLALASWRCGADSLDNARRAQALLGAERWSQVIAIDNASTDGRYPATVHALVFEFAGILWFYTDADGTQSFSLHHGNLAAEKADFAPLLREIDPGFGRWRVVEPAADDNDQALMAAVWGRAGPLGPPRTPIDDRSRLGAPSGRALPGSARSAVAEAEPLLNGCFIESVAAWERRVARGEETGAPRLLSYYFLPGAAKAGHTVLAFEARDRIEVFDPARPEAKFAFPKRAGRDALALARALDGKTVSKARFLALPAPPPASIAADRGPRGTAPAGA